MIEIGPYEIEWSGAGDYCVGRINGRDEILIQRTGTLWEAFTAPAGDLIISRGNNLRAVQDSAARWLQAQA